MKVVLISFYSLFITIACIGAANIELPEFQTSTQLTDYVKKSLQQDVDTMNFLELSMSMPVKKAKRVNRKLKKNFPKDKNMYSVSPKMHGLDGMDIQLRPTITNRKLTKNLTKAYKSQTRPMSRKLPEVGQNDEDFELAALSEAAGETDQKSNFIRQY